MAITQEQINSIRGNLSGVSQPSISTTTTTAKPTDINSISDRFRQLSGGNQKPKPSLFSGLPKFSGIKQTSQRQLLGGVPAPLLTQETVEDVQQIGREGREANLANIEAQKDILSRAESGEISKPAQFRKQFFADMGTAQELIGSLFKGAIKTGLSQETEDKVKAGMQKVGEFISTKKFLPGAVELEDDKLIVGDSQTLIEYIKPISDEWDGLKKSNPSLAEDIVGIVNTVLTALDATALVSFENQARKQGFKILDDIDIPKPPPRKLPPARPTDIAKPADLLKTDKFIDGIQQTTGETLERIPRAFGRGQDFIEQRAARSALIRESEPAVADAIKVNVESKLIDSITGKADDLKSLELQKKMFDTAERGGRSADDAAETVVEQIKLIEDQRKTVGKQIGEAVDELVGQPVDMTDSFQTLKRILRQQGAFVDEEGSLVWRGFRFTGQQQKKIDELWDLTVKNGDIITPRDVYDADRVFSQLGRDARFDGVGNIMVTTPDGTKDIFRVFRDVFSSELDQLSPSIRSLNGEYQGLRAVLDDANKSLLKTPKFQTTRDMDLSTSAGINLRRLESNAQSAGAFREIAENIDEMARRLGYDGMRADDAINFALEMERLFPSSIPKASFSGSIKTGIGDLLPALQKFGAPNLLDQQKAVNNLIEAMINKGGKNSILKANTVGKPVQVAGRQAKTGLELTGGQRHITKLDEFEKAKNLTPEGVGMETKSFESILKNGEDHYMILYKEKFGDGGLKDHVVSADNFRQFFASEGYNGANAANFQEPASYLAKRMYTLQLQNKGQDAVFLAGGSGTGKSSAIKGLDELNTVIDESAVVLDSNLSGLNSARGKIAEAFNAGKKPKVFYVYREQIDAWVNGVIKRMLENPEELGRLVPSDVTASNMIDSWEVVTALHKQGIDVRFIDNSFDFGKQKLISFEEMSKKVNYPSKDELTKMFNDEAKKLFEKGLINEKQYAGLIKPSF